MFLIAPLYGLLCYAVFFVTVLYAVGFVGNVVVPKSVDVGGLVDGPLLPSLLVNGGLLGVFAIQHSVMARAAFKRWWTRYVPDAVERSTYVLLASAALILLFAFWRPLTTPVWTLEGVAARGLLAVQIGGWILVVASTFMIDHFELFGLKQALTQGPGHPPGEPLPPPVFRTPLAYRRVRHPIYLGFLLAFWAAPQMTAGHLLFAAASTGYILIGIWFEERDLIALFGDQYRRYRAEVGMLLPRPGPRFDVRGSPAAATAAKVAADTAGGTPQSPSTTPVNTRKSATGRD